MHRCKLTFAALILFLLWLTLRGNSMADAGSQALVLMQLGEMHRAINALANSEDIGDVKWQTAAALTCLCAGEFRLAYEIAISVLKEWHDETIMLLSALSAMGCGESEAAIQLLTQLLASQPRHHQLFPKLLLNLLGVRTDDEGNDKMHPEAAEFVRSFLLMQRGELALAKETLLRLRKLLCENPETKNPMQNILALSAMVMDGELQLIMQAPYAGKLPRDEILRIGTMATNSPDVIRQWASIRRPLTVISSTRRAKHHEDARLVSGRIQVAVDASEIADALHVTFYVDCQPRHTVRHPPFVWEWDTSNELPGMHTLTVVVFGRDGSARAASSQKFFVSAPRAILHRPVQDTTHAPAEAPIIRRAHHNPTSQVTQPNVENQAVTSKTTLEPNVSLKRLIGVDCNGVELMLGVIQERLGEVHEAFHTFGNLYWRTRDEVLLKRLLMLRSEMMRRYKNLPLVINAAPNWRKAVALTFDDGPRTPYTERILKLLSHYKAKATFFVVGEMVKIYPDLLRAIVEAGHEVGNHSYTHTPARLLNGDDIERELILADIAISETCGVHPILFRPPGGGTCGALFKVLSEQRYSCALWNINIGSYHGTPQEIAARMLGAVKNGSIILMHNGMDMSVDVLPYLLDGLRALGYEVASLGELLGLNQGRCEDIKLRG